MKQLNLVSRGIVPLVCCLTVGCADTVPKCGDEDTIALVKQIASQQIAPLGDLTESQVQLQLSLEYPRASSFDAAIKKYECEARLIAAGAYQLPITYETQVDDNGEHIVALGGMQRGDLYGLANATVAGLAKAKAEAAKRLEASPSPERSVPLAASAANLPVAIPSPVHMADTQPSNSEPTHEPSTQTVTAPPVSSPDVSNAGNDALFNPNSKCGTAEKTLFSCITERSKRIEVCDAGRTIKYSFGKVGANPDIVLSVPRDKATTHQWDGMGGETYTINIPNGTTVYSVYSGIEGKTESDSQGYSMAHRVGGVNVIINGDAVANVACSAQSMDENAVINLEGVELNPE